MKNRIFIAFILLTLPGLLFAGTAFEAEKKTYTPYVGDRGGFRSLFVNPAGAAGQSGFELSVEVGARGSMNDINALSALGKAASTMASAGAGDLEVDTVEDLGPVLSDLYDAGVINDTTIDFIFAGTSMDSVSGLDWTDPNAVIAAAGGLTQPELDAIVTNFDTNVTNGNLETALSSVDVTLDGVASAQIGFLIKGFGLGVYDHAAVVASVSDLGFQTIYNELGIIVGGGFNLFKGKLALGLSGNYSILSRYNNLSFEDLGNLMTEPMNYGYAWGLDIGMVWRPTPSVGIGLVMNDVVGWTEYNLSNVGTLATLFPDAIFPSSFKYEYTVDMDVGFSWQPDWRFVRPKFGFDFYDVISYGQNAVEQGWDFETAMYRALDNIRVGAGFTFFNFLNIAFQYYDHYIALGAGLDLLFLEVYGEIKANESIFYEPKGDYPVGADLMVRIHF